MPRSTMHGGKIKNDIIGRNIYPFKHNRLADITANEC